MNTNDQDRIEKLLHKALPPTTDAAPAPEPSHDLWPEVLRRLDARPAAPPWFDWALLAALAALAAFFPASIPLFLYYL